MNVKDARRVARSMDMRAASARKLAGGEFGRTSRWGNSSQPNEVGISDNIAKEMRQIAKRQEKISQAINTALDETMIEINL
jgi:hypothetical protein